MSLFQQHYIWKVLCSNCCIHFWIIKSSKSKFLTEAVLFSSSNAILSTKNIDFPAIMYIRLKNHILLCNNFMYITHREFGAEEVAKPSAPTHLKPPPTFTHMYVCTNYYTRCTLLLSRVIMMRDS